MYTIFVGAFRVEMQRKDEKDRKITCKYDPLEVSILLLIFVIKSVIKYIYIYIKPGEYQINVKWSGKHVPGSPFIVKIFKTSEEFEKFNQNACCTQKLDNDNDHISF